MERIQTGTYLHLFHFIHGFPVGINNAGFIEGKLSVREQILDNEILAFLGIYKRSNIGVFLCNHWGQPIDLIL